MNKYYNNWKKIFLFSIGLFAGAAFCMKWMEGDFVQNGEKFSIIGLELTYPKETVVRILAGLEEPVKKILAIILVLILLLWLVFTRVLRLYA